MVVIGTVAALKPFTGQPRAQEFHIVEVRRFPAPSRSPVRNQSVQGSG